MTVSGLLWVMIAEPTAWGVDFRLFDQVEKLPIQACSLTRCSIGACLSSFSEGFVTAVGVA